MFGKITNEGAATSSMPSKFEVGWYEARQTLVIKGYPPVQLILQIKNSNLNIKSDKLLFFFVVARGPVLGFRCVWF